LQPDLFTDRAFDLTPAAGQAEPLLWVRRLIIWEEPSKEIRDIPLRQGLNIVWSPDDGSRRGQIGHGGGKTTFCRLLRYCLGEDSFGPEGQRRAIFDDTGSEQAILHQFHATRTSHSDRVPTPGMDRQTRRCHDERGRAQDQRERSATTTILLSVKVGRGTWKLGPT
jgi:hypothetical protein